VSMVWRVALSEHLCYVSCKLLSRYSSIQNLLIVVVICAGCQLQSTDLKDSSVVLQMTAMRRPICGARRKGKVRDTIQQLFMWQPHHRSAQVRHALSRDHTVLHATNKAGPRLPTPEKWKAELA